jgi:zinc protease
MKAHTVAQHSAVSIPGVAFVEERGGISEYNLTKNGLRILLAPNDSQPVVGVMVTYHVGSRNEATGYTGATHLLEHLMFKGAEKFHPSKGTNIDRMLESRGALLNATTWLDRTNYYEVVPRDAVSLAIEIEADRMRTAAFTEEDRQSEMPVVRNEFERGENDPMQALDKEVWAAAFMAHPYHHSTIGWRSDIEGVSIERLRQFYDEFYWPDNATISIAGGFDPEEVLLLIKKFFGVYTKKPEAYPAMYTEEPPQQGERRVTVNRAGTPMICISHKIPPARHEDLPALLVLATVLQDDKSSRLYKAFIDTAKATDVATYCNRFHDASLFQTYVTLTPALTHQKAEDLLLKEYAAICAKGITAKELAAAKRSMRISFSHRTDGPYALLSALNEDIAMGDWRQYVTLPEALQNVTVKDVQRVARTYFVEGQSTVGWFIPTT